MALRYASCSCCCCTPNIGRHLATVVRLACMACGVGFTANAREIAKPVHLEKVVHVFILCLLLLIMLPNS